MLALFVMMIVMMHGVVVECIVAEDCCEMMGCVVMATWLLCLLVFVCSLIWEVWYLRTFTSKFEYRYLVVVPILRSGISMILSTNS